MDFFGSHCDMWLHAILLLIFPSWMPNSKLLGRYVARYGLTWMPLGRLPFSKALGAYMIINVLIASFFFIFS